MATELMLSTINIQQKDFQVTSLSAMLILNS